jgi:hypothetical protein
LIGTGSPPIAQDQRRPAGRRADCLAIHGPGGSCALRLPCSSPPGSQRQPPPRPTEPEPGGLSRAGGELFLVSQRAAIPQHGTPKIRRSRVREVENNSTNFILFKTMGPRFGITPGVIPLVVSAKSVRPLANSACRYAERSRQPGGKVVTLRPVLLLICPNKTRRNQGLEHGGPRAISCSERSPPDSVGLWWRVWGALAQAMLVPYGRRQR